MADRPNVLVFVSHDSGRCVSPLGYDTFDTPNCERLAAEGVTLTRAFCTTPLCSPARGALLTGRYPHQNGLNGLVGDHRGFRLHESERHAARLFADAGYESVLCGQVHESNDCTTLGFQRFLCGPGEKHNDGGDLLDYGRGIGEWLAGRDTGRPFYLQVGCSDTHRDWRKRAEPDSSRGVWQPPYLEPLPDVADDVAAFQGGMKRLDEGIGGILDALDRAGVADTTMCVFTTDHGEDLPSAKGTCYDPGIGVFCFLRYPRGGWGAGRRFDELVSHVDILPTLLEACGVDAPDNLAGRSQLARLNGDADEPVRDAIFAGKTFHDGFDPRRAVRTQRWKYICYLELVAGRDVRHATFNRQHQMLRPTHPAGPEELYDLEQDPHELHDLAGDPDHADVLVAMRHRLAEHMKATEDPLLHGPISSPRYEQVRAQLREA